MQWSFLRRVPAFHWAGFFALHAILASACEAPTSGEPKGDLTLSDDTADAIVIDVDLADVEPDALIPDSLVSDVSDSTGLPETGQSDAEATDTTATDATATDTAATDIAQTDATTPDGSPTDSAAGTDATGPDSAVPATCGDGKCGMGENPKNCKPDCCGTCGDGQCKGYACGESGESCGIDCGTACGNGLCDKGESPASCAIDCAWQACGNGTCESTDGGPDACPEDCGAACGDGQCAGGEDFVLCPVDCGYCGDGYCVLAAGEDGLVCPLDCAATECDPKVASLPGGATQCDDENPCTHDTCAPSGQCNHQYQGGSCDDGSECTLGDKCVLGACVPAGIIDCNDNNPCTAETCIPGKGCVYTNTTAACDDGNACTVGDVCKDSGCKSGQTANCEDGNPCTDNPCDLSDGCTAVALSGPVCTDGDLCTTGDVCQNGVCAGAGQQACDDGNPCTTDGCSAESGCVQLPSTATCSDGNSCTTGDSCVNAVCTPGAQVSCNDDNPCTADSCNVALGCVNKPTTGACSDGDTCTVGDVCKQGKCQGGTQLDCDDGNPCTTDGCATDEGCISAAVSGPCFDGDVCSTNDQCVDGICAAGNEKDCSDGNPCTSDECDPLAGCRYLAVPGNCTDGNACTQDDTCFGGLCMGEGGLNCNDANPCTTDTCSKSGGCQHTALQGPCSDGDLCTEGDSCADGSCVAGMAVDCSDDNTCTTDSCATATGCAHLANNGAPCSDGNPCTALDRCAGGVCSAFGTLPCNDANPCTVDRCEPENGACEHDPAVLAGSICNDGDFCTTVDLCAPDGTCTGADALSCDDGNACTNDACNPSAGCIYLFNAKPCDDANTCTELDTCGNGLCVGLGRNCNDNNPCTVDACAPLTGQCTYSGSAILAGIDCTDGNVCTTQDTCGSAGACVGGTAADCNDNNPCTADLCNKITGCKYLADNTQVCSDGNGCTLGDRCVGGLCTYDSYKNCVDGNACTLDACTPATGACNNAGAASFWGAPCSDGKLCTTGDACNGQGQCLPTGAIQCDDGNPCTSDKCDNTLGCTFEVVLASPCSDDNLCTLADSCTAQGLCVGQPKSCDDGLACSADSCNAATGACVSSPAALLGAACSDGNACTLGDRCDGVSASCSPGQIVASCDDGNVCTVDACLPSSGCSNVANTATCEDGNPCTTGDRCQAGLCVTGGAKDTDLDGSVDVVCGGADCDDANALIRPDQAETRCDNADDNCNAQTDEGCDDDDDGYCDSALSVSTVQVVVTCPLGGGDCADTNALANPGATDVPDLASGGPYSATGATRTDEMTSSARVRTATFADQAFVLTASEDPTSPVAARRITVATRTTLVPNWRTALPPSHPDDRQTLDLAVTHVAGSTVLHLLVLRPVYQGGEVLWRLIDRQANVDAEGRLAGWTETELPIENLSEDVQVEAMTAAGAESTTAADAASQTASLVPVMHLVYANGTGLVRGYARWVAGSWSVGTKPPAFQAPFAADADGQSTSSSPFGGVHVAWWTGGSIWYARVDEGFGDTAPVWVGTATEQPVRPQLVAPVVPATQIQLFWPVEGGLQRSQAHLSNSTSWTSPVPAGVGSCLAASDATRAGSTALFWFGGCVQVAYNEVLATSQLSGVTSVAAVQGGLLGGSFANQLGANGLPVAPVVGYTNDWLTEFAPEPSGGSSAWTATGVVPRPVSPVRANPFSAGSQGVLHGMLGVLDTGMGPYTRFVTETRLAGGGLDLASVPFQTSGLPTDASFRMAAVASHPLTGAVGHWILADSLTEADRYLLLYRPALSSPLVSQLRLAGWTPLGTATAPTPIPTPGGGFVLAGLTAQGSGAARLGALSGWNTWQSAASTSEQTLQLIAFPESSTGFVAAVTGMPLTPALDQFGTWECGSKGIRARSWSAQTLAPTGSPTLWSTLPCTEIHVRSEHSGDGVVSGTRHVVARVNGSLVYWRAAASTGASVSLIGWQQTVLAANLPASDAISVSPALLGEVAIATGDQLWVRDGGPWGAAPLLDPTWFDAAPSLPWQIAGGQQGEAPVLVGAALFPKLLGLGVERYWDSWLTWQPFNSIDDNCNGQ